MRDDDDEKKDALSDPPMSSAASTESTASNVAPSRTNNAPPRMAFLRIVGSKLMSSSTSDNTNEEEETLQQEQMQGDFSLEDDLTSSLLPPSPSRFPNIRRPVLHPERIVAARQLIRRSGNYLAYCTLLTMLILVPSVLYSALSNRKVDIAAFNSAWVMVCGTIVLSLRLVYLHLTHWYMPTVQKYVVRILWMVPIYAIQSYLSLRFHHARVYMSAIRDFYEAYVIASFVYYLIELLGGQDALVQTLREKNPSYGQHSFPFKLVFEPWEMGLEFMLQCKHGVLQYVVFKSLAALLTSLCEFNGVYQEGTFNWLVAYPYLVFFQNLSVWYALYSLVIFFHAVNDELRHPVDWHPLGKFLCIKGVVFFTWWQGVVIFSLRDHGFIEAMGSWSSLDVANGLIDYCIIVEMIGFSIAHSYTFTYTEYMPGRLPPPSSQSPEVPNGDSSDSNGGLTRNVSATYRPPATLPQPLDFKTAFWSSTVPRETLEDIQRLRSGIDGAMAFSEANRQRSLSLQEMNTEDTDPLVVPEDEVLVRSETMHI